MVKTESAINVVCDAGPLIHLDELDQMRLMKDFHEILVPEAVLDEVKIHRPDAFEKFDAHWSVVPPPRSVDKNIGSICTMFSLDKGETEAIHVMNKHSHAVLLTDDAAARLVASKLSFRVHGTIGILIRSIRRGMLSRAEVVAILTELPVLSTLHIKQSLLETIITQVGSH